MKPVKAAGYPGGLLLLLALLAGCASAPQTRLLLTQPDASLPRRAELVAVPFHPQQRYQCGPAALATVLNWSGVDIDPDTLKDEVYLPARQGSLQLEILAGTRRHQRLAYVLAPHLDSLLREVVAGHPVLVLQNLGLGWAPVWHYAVVVGYDLDRETLILRSGLEARHATPLSTFERTWARGGYWAMLALPPDQLPAEADADTYVEACVLLERARHGQAAHSAYQTALQRWPDNLIAQLGLGNTAYQLGDKPAAARAFEAAVKAHPDSGIAHNNLAQVYLELGNIAAARRHAQQAVILGGPQLEAFRATLRAIPGQP